MERLKGKIVIITGASSGIGKSLAYCFAREGANIILASRQYPLTCAIAQDIESKFPIKAIAIATDVSKEEYCKNLINETIRIFGRIDILINNAGISMRALVKDVELSVLKEVMDVNFWGAVYCTKYALPEILKNNGSIVGVSSVAGYKGLPGRSGYSASKFAIHGFLESLRIENRKSNLHVMIACPGFTATNIRNNARAKDGSLQGESPINENKIMSPDIVADKMVRAIIKRKRTISLTLQGKATIFLNKFYSNLVDRFVYKFFAREPHSPLS